MLGYYLHCIYKGANCEKKYSFFEARSGNDKGEDDYRKDTMPMINALKNQNCKAEVIFFKLDKKDEIYKYTKNNINLLKINQGEVSCYSAGFASLIEFVNLIAKNTIDVVSKN